MIGYTFSPHDRPGPERDRRPGFPEPDADPLTRDVAFARRSFKHDRKSPYDNGKVQVGTDGLAVRLIQGIDEAAAGLVLAAMENSSFGLTDEMLDGMEMEAATRDPGQTSEMFEGGLQGALDTQWVAFAVRGVSRTCTHQLVRSSRAKFHQQSQRVCYAGSRPEFRMPESIWTEGGQVFRL